MGSQKWVDSEFGERLRRLRIRQEWTQAQLADLLNDNGIPMTSSQVARVEKGERSVRAVEAAVLADLYGLSVDALLGRRARPKADLIHAIRGVLDAKHQATWQLSTLERTLKNAGDELADADTGNRYAELGADCINACKALEVAGQVLASIGDTTNPGAAAAVKAGTLAMMRTYIAENEADA